MTGKIELRNVGFRYPTRPQQVLKDVSLVVEAGERVALVGYVPVLQVGYAPVAIEAV